MGRNSVNGEEFGEQGGIFQPLRTIDDVTWRSVLQFENRLAHGNFRGRRVVPDEGNPVIDHDAPTNHIGAAIDGASDERDLEQRGELIEIPDGCFGVDEATIVAKGAVSADEDIAGDGLAEDLDAEGVGDNLLRFLAVRKKGENADPIQVRMDEGHVIIAGNAIAKRGEFLFHTLNDHGVWQRVADVHQLLIGAGIGEENALLVARREAAHNLGAGDRRVNDRDGIRQLVLPHFVVVASSYAHQTVRICELSEDSNLIVLLKLCTDRHES